VAALGEGRLPTYREIAEPLAAYVHTIGLHARGADAVTEHPFYGSWGYQTTGYFAPTARYGTPQDFMYLVDVLHRHGIGVILDWVPSHFPTTARPGKFDGTHLYEHADPRRGFHPEWKSNIFNYGRHEVRAFLISSALFWLEKYHVDGIRVDAVASMLYLDYGRKAGEWIPNVHGGKEDLEAIEFLKQLNIAVGREHPDARTHRGGVDLVAAGLAAGLRGGLGFSMKWNMGWMHDTLDFMAHDPIHRRYHHNELTFSLWYAFSENFVLPLSHDEVVHGKTLAHLEMPATAGSMFANLRLLFGWMWTHPGKKLLFMGGEFGQWREWSHDRRSTGTWRRARPRRDAALDRGPEPHLPRRAPRCTRATSTASGFEWIDGNDSENSVITFLRWPDEGGRPILVACNFTPVVREGYRIGLPLAGAWREVLNSDAPEYGGSGVGNLGRVESEETSWHGGLNSACVTLPAAGDGDVHAGGV
jgi:1,4-alpha-glucan branching enzyme